MSFRFQYLSIRLLFSLLMLLVLFVLGACSGASSSTLGEGSQESLLGGGQVGDFSELLGTGQGHWEKRITREDTEEAIRVWTKAISVDDPSLTPGERKLQLRTLYLSLARAYFFLADSHVLLADPEGEAHAQTLERLYHLGRTYAERALALGSSGFQSKVTDGGSIEEASKSLQIDDVGAIYWWSANFGRWLSFQSNFAAFGMLGDLKAMVRRLEELDSSYFHHGPLRLLGGMSTKLPLPSGDLPKSRKYLEEAIQQSPQMLANKIVFAEWYAVAAEDRALFERLLNEVLETSEDISPALRPENHFEHERARQLLEKAGQLF